MKDKNYIVSTLVGALTSKPYAFTARSWELRNIESIDIFDSMGSNIKLSTRGSSILRVLPKINDFINEEWITDKVRFSYDALKFQRIVHCYKKIDGRFEKINWNQIFSLLNKNNQKELDFDKNNYVLKKSTNKVINFFVGSFVDHETLNTVSNLSSTNKNYFNLVSSNSIFNSSNKTFINKRSNFLFENFSKINDFNLCLLLGCNLRYEAPLLNLKIRKNVVSKNLFVYNVGFNYKNNFSLKNVGASTKNLKYLLESKSVLNKKLNKNSLIIFGNSFATMENFPYLFSALKNKYSNTNIIQSEASLVNFYETGLFFNNPPNKKDDTVCNWFLDDDKTKIKANFLSVFSKKENFDINIYQGHHNDYNFNSSDIVLPATLYSEKNATFLNFFGLRQQTKFIDSKILNTAIREDSKIIKNLFISDSNNDAKNYLNSQRGYRISDNSQLSLHVLKSNSNKTTKMFLVKNTLIVNYMEDFYRNDSITRNSPIMALVSNRSNHKISSFNEN